MYQEIVEHLSGDNAWPILLAGIGQILWWATYVFFIRAGFRDRTYPVPMVATCLNLTWELYFSFVCPWTEPGLCPSAATLEIWSWRIWFVLDLVVFVQLLVYGRSEGWALPEVKRHFYACVALLLGFGYLGQTTFVAFFEDHNGAIVGYLINLVMSALFLGLLGARPDLRGLSYAGAWTKMLGTGLISISFATMRPSHFPTHETESFMYVLYLAIFILDLAYVVLLGRRRRERRAGQGSSPGQPGLLSAAPEP